MERATADEGRCLVLLAPTALPAALADELSARLPAWRREACARYRRSSDRDACITAWSLFRAGWSAVGAGDEPEAVVSPAGRPELPGSGWHLSLSHRDGWAACALARAEVGVDVHGRVPYRAGLLRRIGSAREQELAPWLEERDDLAPVWTRKEALAKRAGTGLSGPIAAIDVADPALHTWTCTQPQLTLSLAWAGADVALTGVDLARGELVAAPPLAPLPLPTAGRS